MSIPGSAHPLLLSSLEEEGYFIERSLRFNSSDSAYLSRTPASAGNRKTWTWAGWVKRSKLGDNLALFGRQQSDDTNTLDIRFGTGDTLRFANFNNYLLETTQVFRDTSAWFHLVVVLDTTQATANNRARMYVNGAEITQFGARSNPTQNADLAINNTTLHHLGATVSSGSVFYPFSGYLADIHFIDGQALDPTSFGEFDATTGVWNPKAYTGSYGTNGFRLDFSDNSAATATTLGKDRAGSNNWTPNNLSVTAGSGNDSLVDVPTNGAQTDTGVGGEVRGNYCTLNPLNNGGVTLVNGNLDWTRSAGGSTAVAYSTIAVSSSKWYFETTMNGAGSGVNWECGVATTTTANNIRPGTTATGWGLVTSSNTIIYKQNSNSLTSIFSGTLSTGDVIGVAFDLDNGRIWFARNNTWLEGSPSAGTGASYTNLSGTVSAFFGGDGSAVNGAANFGQRPFAYTAPSGFKALNTANLPAPLVTKPSDVMDVKLYTGNGSTQTISGLGFSPDLAWFKRRDSANNHALFDAVRGAGKFLLPNGTGAEGTDNNSLISFDANGVTVGQSVSAPSFNISSGSYVAWAWDAGTTTVSNTQGSISSQVRANASAGFSIVTYTGNGSAGATVGHGLNVAPQLLINKRRSSTGTTADWAVWHKSVADISGSSYVLFLNTTDAALSASNRFNSTAPTSSVFTLGNADATNYNGGTFVTYCFAPVAGYSSIGSFVGNSSAEGPFVYTGFRVRWLMVKNADATTDWVIVDTARETYNVVDDFLRPNSSAAEGTRANLAVDLLSNGFKLRGLDNFMNGSNTHVYLALAESPFQYARAR